MKQYLLLILLSNILILIKSYNLRNLNSEEVRIESNYNSDKILQELEGKKLSDKNEDSRKIQDLKEIIEKLVINNINNTIFFYILVKDKSLFLF